MTLLDGLAKLLQLVARREDERLSLEERLPARVHLARHLARVEALLLESRHVVVAICGRMDILYILHRPQNLGNNNQSLQSILRLLNVLEVEQVYKFKI